jgi:hypothetical protein
MLEYKCLLFFQPPELSANNDSCRCKDERAPYEPHSIDFCPFKNVKSYMQKISSRLVIIFLLVRERIKNGPSPFYYSYRILLYMFRNNKRAYLWNVYVGCMTKHFCTECSYPGLMLFDTSESINTSDETDDKSHTGWHPSHSTPFVHLWFIVQFLINCA